MKFRSSLDKYRRAKPEVPGSKTLTVTVESLTNEGDGVARVEGKATFVPHTAPGDKVQIKVTEDRRRFSRARVVKLIEPSPHRVTPECQWVEQCGGCTWQHLSYEHQLETKRAQLIETLTRIGNLPNVVTRDIVPSPTPYAYRNRIRGVSENGQFHFHQARSEFLVAIDSCAIAHPTINQYIAAPTQAFSNDKQSIELALMSDESVTAFGVDTERSTELGFRQVNDAVSQILTNTVSEIISEQLANTQDDAGPMTLLDLYCGHGSWTRRIAERHPNLTAVGVDISEHNIRIARKQAAGIKNATFSVGRAEKALQQNNTQNDFIIVDPPRAGLNTEVIQALTANTSAATAQNATPTLLYISCHPATLARDLSALSNSGYDIEFVQPFDMFPQTPHVESLAVLRRKN